MSVRERIHQCLRNQFVYGLLAAAAGELAGLAPITHHDDAVRKPHDFFDLGGDEHHRHAVTGQRDDLVHDFLFGGDVDAARRLIQDQKPRLGRQPAREDRLLLVAA